MDLLKASNSLFEESVSLRRQFHMHPEMSFQEHKTAEKVAEVLQDLGFQVQTGVAQTGVVGLMQCPKPGPVFLLRFDMDALPVHEENQTDYASKIPGVMHACGHDSHVSIGLTVAKMIEANRNELFGTYKLVFQPAEELGQGAQAMFAEGVLENPKPDYALGLHVWNEEKYGWLGVSSGPVMAGSGTFKIKVIGKGGHGAVPQFTHDPILAGSQIVTALQSIASREIAPTDSGVVSVTMVHGGTADNIIPPSLELGGTYRYFHKETHALIKRRIQEISETVAIALGCRAEVQVIDQTIPVNNDPQVTQAALRALQTLKPGAEPAQNYRTMGGEDMSFFLERIPGVFFFIGSADPENDKAYPHHHPRFDIDERAMIIGPALLLQTCQELALSCQA